MSKMYFTKEHYITLHYIRNGGKESKKTPLTSLGERPEEFWGTVHQRGLHAWNESES